MPQGKLDHSDISGWAPALREKCLPTGVVPEEVEGFVNGLLLDNDVLPAGEAFANLHKFCMSTGTCVVQRDSDILDAGRHFTKRIITVLGIGVDGVERGAHALGDFADFSQEGVPVGEDDENILPSLRSRHGIDERFDDISVVHIQVPPQYAP